MNMRETEIQRISAHGDIDKKNDEGEGKIKMKNYVYKNRKQNRIETDDVVISVHQVNRKYQVNVMDKKTLDLQVKDYNKKECVNNVTEKYDVHIDFDEPER